MELPHTVPWLSSPGRKRLCEVSNAATSQDAAAVDAEARGASTDPDAVAASPAGATAMSAAVMNENRRAFITYPPVVSIDAGPTVPLKVKEKSPHW
jgi:hypothetical protein